MSSAVTRLEKAVATGGTFPIHYPAGLSQGDLSIGGAHRMVVAGAARSSPGDFILTFGATSITVTWLDPSTLPAGAVVVLQIDTSVPTGDTLLLRPEPFGAKGDGITDDTAALQRALDAIPNDGGLMLRGGAIYLASNLSIPGRATITSDGLSHIRAIAAGDPRYLVAAGGWLTNSTAGHPPLRISNVVFEANDIKDYGFITTSRDSNFNGIECSGANVAGFYVTDISEDGTQQAFGAGAMRIDQCIFRNNNGDGLRSEGQTDFIFVNSKSHTNGGWGWSFTTMGGGQLHGLYAFGNTLGSALLRNFGFSTTVMGCQWDGDVEIGSVYSTDDSQMPNYGPGNVHKNALLKCTMAGTGQVTLVLDDPIMVGAASQIIHGFNGASRKLIVNGGTSASPNPITYHSATSAGTILVNRHYSRYAGGYLDGIVQKNISTDADPVATNILYVDKTLDAATSTGVVLVLTVPPDQNAGSTFRVELDALCRSAGAIQTYTAEVHGSYSRVAASATNASVATVVNAVTSGGSGMSAAAVVGMSGTTGDHTVTVTITLTHRLPTAASGTMLRAKAAMTHRYTTAATLA